MALFRLISVTSCMIYMTVADIATSTRNYVVLAEFCLESVDLRNFVKDT